MSNPYAYGVPVLEPTQFFGREFELSDVFGFIAQHACVNVIGERRIGKTSFLKHIIKPEVRQIYGSTDEDAIFVYIDPEIVSPESPQGFYTEILKQSGLISDPGAEIPIEAVGQARRSPADHGETATTPDVGLCDERTLRSVLDDLQPRRMVILVDEFEIIADNENFPFGFFEFLRGCSTHYGISFILATSRPLAECCPHHIRSSPFPNIFQRLSLGPFSKKEFELFVQETSRQSGAPLMRVRDDIEEMAGRFPYLVKMVSSLYYRAWSHGHELRSELRPQIEYEFMSEARAHFGSLWDHHLTAEERSVLSLLANGQSADVPSFILWSLNKRGHIEDHQIVSLCFADFVRRRGVDARPADHEMSLTPTTDPKVDIDTSVGLWLDQETGQVFIDGQQLETPPTDKEYRLLSLLWENRGGVCSYYDIVMGVWGDEFLPEVEDRRIHALVRRLRRKVEPRGHRPWQHVVTLHGRGLTLKGYAGARETDQ